MLGTHLVCSQFALDWSQRGRSSLNMRILNALLRLPELRALPSVVQRDLSTVVLKMVEDLIVCAVWALVGLSIRSHDLLHIFLLDRGLLLTHLNISLLGHHVIVNHAFRYFALHLEQFCIHCDRVHTVHDRLP